MFDNINTKIVTIIRFRIMFIFQFVYTINTEERPEFSIEQILVEKYTSFAVTLLDVQ